LRGEARAPVYFFDEARIGSGINAMRFLHAGKPLIGFYAAEERGRRINLTNVLQLAIEFPERVRLAAYRRPEEITARLAEWLRALGAQGGSAVKVPSETR